MASPVALSVPGHPSSATPMGPFFVAQFRLWGSVRSGAEVLSLIRLMSQMCTYLS